MKKKFTVGILGCGGRGQTYAKLMTEKEEFEVVSVCDCKPSQLERINNIVNLPEDKLFVDEHEYLSEKRADVIVIATCDKDHVRQCIKAMELGSDVLLEKPVSDSIDEIHALLETQKKTGRTVVVCHVLRYSTAVKKLDELIKSGILGRLIAIDHFERVAFWHQAQAYARIQKMHFDKTHPTILAKCCHDLDLIQHFAKAKCESVSSIGGLAHFRAENAPEGATDRCVDCPHIDTCTYSAKKLYIDFWKERSSPKYSWPWNKPSTTYPVTEEGLWEGMRTTVYGECAFKCGIEKDPHVVDHQMVQMNFKNGVIASLKMVFGAKPGRRIDFFGTEGQITFDEIYDTIEVKPYFKPHETINVSALNDSGWGHGGGDTGLVNNLYDILIGVKTEYTSLEESLESHLIGVCAEESRLSGGKLVKVH